MKKLKKYVWLKKSETPKKSDIEIEDGKAKILPDFFKVKIKRIIVLTTLGCTMRNYCKVVLSDHSFYFINMSMESLKKILPLKLIKISKYRYINIRFVTERFNHTFVFIRGVAYKVSKRYKENLKTFFDDS